MLSAVFGSHLSIAGGMVNALVEARRLKMDTVQVFTKNQRQWRVTPMDPGAAREWLAELRRLGWERRTVAHDSYLINLASPDDELWERSIRAMRDEIERAAALSIPYLVSHPGAHMLRDGPLTPNGRIEAGLRRIAAAYKRLLRDTRGTAVTICLENTAGGGTTLGRTFEELARLRELILEEAGGDADLLHAADERVGGVGRRVGFCLDTCHALAAGYDIARHDAEGRRRTVAQGRRAGEAMLAEFDRVCGLGRLKVVHMNDSGGGLGSRIDRHAHIGRGQVSGGVFAAVVNHPALACVPKILETPKEEDESGIPMDIVNLRRLRRLMDRRKIVAGGTEIAESSAYRRCVGGGRNAAARPERVSCE